jgi:heat shock protein HspQ
MGEGRASFSIGQLIHHKRFGYRGVIVDVDSTFQLSDEWYERMARSRPPKDRPWYHVLVHDSAQTTYVAEQNLETDEDKAPIRHPLVDEYFSEFRDGVYIVARKLS